MIKSLVKIYMAAVLPSHCYLVSLLQRDFFVVLGQLKMKCNSQLIRFIDLGIVYVATSKSLLAEVDLHLVNRDLGIVNVNNHFIPKILGLTFKFERMSAVLSFPIIPKEILNIPVSEQIAKNDSYHKYVVSFSYPTITVDKQSPTQRIDYLSVESFWLGLTSKFEDHISCFDYQLVNTSWIVRKISID